MPASRVTVKATFVEEDGEEAAEPFVDVSAGDWFYDAVVYVYDNGLMSGTAATTFGPNVGTTRGMIAPSCGGWPVPPTAEPIPLPM